MTPQVVVDPEHAFHRALSAWERERMQRRAIRRWGTWHPAFRDQVRTIVLAELETALGADLTALLARRHDTRG